MLEIKSLNEGSLIIEKERPPSGMNILDTESEPLLEHKQEAIGFWRALQIPGVVEYSLCLFFAKLVLYTYMYVQLL